MSSIDDITKKYQIHIENMTKVFDSETTKLNNIITDLNNIIAKYEQKSTVTPTDTSPESKKSEKVAVDGDKSKVCVACGNRYDDLSRHNDVCPDMLVICELHSFGKCDVQMKRCMIDEHNRISHSRNLELRKGMHIDLLVEKDGWIPVQIVDIDDDTIHYLPIYDSTRVMKSLPKSESDRVLPYKTITGHGIYVGRQIEVTKPEFRCMYEKAIVNQIDKNSFISIMFDTNEPVENFMGDGNYRLWLSMYSDAKVDNYYTLVNNGAAIVAKLLKITENKYVFGYVDGAKSAMAPTIMITMSTYDGRNIVYHIGANPIFGTVSQFLAAQD
jgi:hypothetical protein